MSTHPDVDHDKRNGPSRGLGARLEGWWQRLSRVKRFPVIAALIFFPLGLISTFSFLQLIRDPELAPGFQWSAALQLATAIACVFWYLSPAQGRRAVITHVGIGVALLLSTGFALYVGMQALRAQALGVSIMQAAGVA